MDNIEDYIREREKKRILNLLHAGWSVRRIWTMYNLDLKKWKDFFPICPAPIVVWKWELNYINGAAISEELPQDFYIPGVYSVLNSHARDSKDRLIVYQDLSSEWVPWDQSSLNYTAKVYLTILERDKKITNLL